MGSSLDGKPSPPVETTGGDDSLNRIASNQGRSGPSYPISGQTGLHAAI